ncbi:GAF domain-containing protein [Streptomyces sp. H39-S7]|uniref:GAF domain-containing protein n=1 Tax=Streptomyces sp. H39-S7 TaxID=3004357 RepID=UPI0022B00C47|nr:GAF domain-containing protein [Streptomyces sp. H39-S7]MCZ4120236.1 GAF domain-containing protein [Streptomyces sp. H39-S7]
MTITAGVLLSSTLAYFALRGKKRSMNTQVIEFKEALSAIMEHLARLAGGPDDHGDLKAQIRDRATSLLATHVRPDARCAFYALENDGRRLQRRGKHGDISQSPEFFTDGDRDGRDLLHAVRRRTIISIPDTQNTNGNLGINLGDDYRSAIIAPVYAGDSAQGVLIIDAPNVDAFAEVHESFVRLIACVLGATQATVVEANKPSMVGEQRGPVPDSLQTGESSAANG